MGSENSNGDPSLNNLRAYEGLGLVSLSELEEFAVADEARAELRREWGEGIDDQDRRREILEQSQRYMSRQLKLLRQRSEAISRHEVELMAKRKRVRAMLRELDVD